MVDPREDGRNNYIAQSLRIAELSPEQISLIEAIRKSVEKKQDQVNDSNKEMIHG